jgi:hypothetical protein
MLIAVFISAVLLTTWIYVAQLLATPAQDLLHFLLLLLLYHHLQVLHQVILLLPIKIVEFK